MSIWREHEVVAASLIPEALEFERFKIWIPMTVPWTSIVFRFALLMAFWVQQSG
jgi:hypothetical protein